MNIQKRHPKEVRERAVRLVLEQQGEYGDCLVCAEAIDPRRLKIDPAQALCIACADK